MATLSLNSETQNKPSDTRIHTNTGRRPARRGLTLLNDLLPQRVHQNRIRMSRTVNYSQLTLRQPEMIRKLSVQLQRKTAEEMFRLGGAPVSDSNIFTYLGNVHELRVQLCNGSLHRGMLGILSAQGFLDLHLNPHHLEDQSSITVSAGFMKVHLRLF